MLTLLKEQEHRNKYVLDGHASLATPEFRHQTAACGRQLFWLRHCGELQVFYQWKQSLLK